MTPEQQEAIDKYLKTHKVTVIDTKEDKTSSEVKVGCTQIGGSML